MRISDWSSDVCSSDLIDRAAEPLLVVVDQVLNGIDGQTDTGDTDEVTVVIDNPIVDEDGHRVPVGQVRIDVDLVGLHHPADTKIPLVPPVVLGHRLDRKSTRLNSSH